MAVVPLTFCDACRRYRAPWRDRLPAFCFGCGQPVAPLDRARIAADLDRMRYLLDEIHAWSNAGLIDRALRKQLCAPYEAGLEIVARHLDDALPCGERPAPFLLFAGSIYFAVYFWDRLGRSGPLVAGGLLAVYGLGFAAIGYLLQRRYRAELSARVLYGVATAILPVASTVLGEPIRAGAGIGALAAGAGVAFGAVAFGAVGSRPTSRSSSSTTAFPRCCSAASRSPASPWASCSSSASCSCSASASSCSTWSATSPTTACTAPCWAGRWSRWPACA